VSGTRPAPVAIGVGNVLRTDDAAGVRVIEGLRARASSEPGIVPPGTRLVDGGTLGLDLLRMLDGARGLVLVDAVRLGGPAGRVSVLRGDALTTACGPRDGGPASAIGELLSVASLMGWLPGPVALVGIEAGDLALGVALTPAVERAIPVAIDAVLTELQRQHATPTIGIHGGHATRDLAGATA
jgi:hydrogenase maturation protease